MRRVLDTLYAVSGALAALCIACIGALMLAQAFGREFGLLIRGADDITAWLSAAAAFLALGHTFRHGELVRVGIMVQQLPARARWWAEVFALGITVVFVAYMAWSVLSFVIDSWRFKEVSQGLIRIPIWIPQLGFAVGVVIFFIAVLDDLVTHLRGGRTSYLLAEDERSVRSAKGDFSETV